MLLKKIFSKNNRTLLQELVRTDFKLRYQGSMLGYAWSLLRPLLLFVILYVVFVKFLRIGNTIPHYPVYLLLGIVIWNFFAEVTSQGVGSIVGRGDLIRKIRIPRWIIVLSSSISALINLALNMIVIAVFMIANHVDLMHTALMLPLILLEVYVFALGLALFLSAAFVKFRDIGYIWEVILQALFYLTPIIYPIAMITNPTLQKILFLNPMGQAVQDARYALVTHHTVTMGSVFTSWVFMMIPILIVVSSIVIGVLYFKRESRYFAENI
ncbi:MAG TPA: ABC transporter permease [Patescibacteria group bacterium]|nr:ABC transporter permease [Patescibacteria group bacterium]